MELTHILLFMVVVPFLASAQQDALCPNGWVHHDQSCYLLHKEKSNWYEAEIVCNGHNAKLASVTSTAENMFLKGLIANTYNSDDDDNVWIGGSDDVVEGQFLWYGSDEPLTFTDWGPSEPNSVPLHLEEDCLVYWAAYSWKWADLDCHDQCYSICEKEVDERNSVIG